MHYVDSDIFLYWATDDAEHGARATKILRHIELNEKAITSTYTLWLLDKVLQPTQGYSLTTLLDQVDKIRNLKVLSLEPDHLREAAEARQRFGVPTEVAIPYAVAKERGVRSVYSSNPAYDQTDLRRDF